MTEGRAWPAVESWGLLAWPRETRPYGEIGIRDWGSLTGGTIKPEPHRLR